MMEWFTSKIEGFLEKFHNLVPPAQPRKLAYYIAAFSNIITGLLFFVTPRTPGTAHVLGPFWIWGLLFVTVGIIILIAQKSNELTFVITLFAIGMWSFYTIFLFEAVNINPSIYPHTTVLAPVTIRYPITVAVLGVWNFVLLPYWRSGVLK